MIKKQIRYDDFRLFDAEYGDNNEVTLIFKQKNNIVRVPYDEVKYKVEKGKKELVIQLPSVDPF